MVITAASRFTGACALAVFVSACQAPIPVIRAPDKPVASSPPPDLLSIPDAVPRAEPLSRKGNPAFYEVLGQRYFVMPSAAGYIERGVASWYGPGFHQASTSNGEPYDMYAMTAAHKTLPLPAYVQVTNLANGKQVVLRVNDRGPFKAGRIIDLSYTAALKLDMLRAGTALVEVRTITPGDMAGEVVNSSPGKISKALYVQAGAFGDSRNADRLVTQLRERGYQQAAVQSEVVNGRSLYRVHIGPIADANGFDQIVVQLKALGIADARLAAD